jgi:hypothetical protein
MGRLSINQCETIIKANSNERKFERENFTTKFDTNENMSNHKRSVLETG